MKRDSWLMLGGGAVVVVIGLFVVFWITVRAWVAFGFLAAVLPLLAFAWWYDRRERRERAGLSGT